MKEVLNELEKEFNSEILQRGQEYYREGLIGNVSKNTNIVKAESYGNSTYLLKIDLKTKEMQCSCPCDFSCKHLAALILWLKNNKLPDVSEQLKIFESKSKEELLIILKNIVKDHPGLSMYFCDIDDKALTDLIKKIWIKYDYDSTFFNKLNFIKQNIMKKKEFNFKTLFLRKLLDMYDHDPETQQLEDYIYDYINEIFDQKLTKSQKINIKEIIKDYPFEDIK